MVSAPDTIKRMPMTLRLPDDLDAHLRQVAQEEGNSLQQAAVIAISEYVERRESAKVRAIFERIAEEDSALLDRLGNS